MNLDEIIFFYFFLLRIAQWVEVKKFFFCLFVLFALHWDQWTFSHKLQSGNGNEGSKINQTQDGVWSDVSDPLLEPRPGLCARRATWTQSSWEKKADLWPMTSRG